MVSRLWQREARLHHWGTAGQLVELGATEGKEMGDGERGQLVRTEGLTVVQSVCVQNVFSLNRTCPLCYIRKGEHSKRVIRIVV